MYTVIELERAESRIRGVDYNFVTKASHETSIRCEAGKFTIDGVSGV